MLADLLDTNMTKLFKQDLQKVIAKLGDGQPAYYYSSGRQYYAYQPTAPYLKVSFDAVRLWEGSGDDDGAHDEDDGKQGHVQRSSSVARN